MRLMNRFFLLLGLAFAACGARGANTEARLLLSHEAAKPGDTILAGVQLTMKPNWHTYWRNSGESGEPTRIDWTLPKGVTAGEIQWPLPERLVSEDLVTFIYHNEVVLLIPLTLAADLAAGPLALKAKVSWLECEKQCVPGGDTVEAAFNVGDPKPSQEAAVLDKWKQNVPQPKPGLDVRARWEGEARTNSRPLLIEWPSQTATRQADFFPYASDAFTVRSATAESKIADGFARVHKRVETNQAWPTELAGVVVERDDGGKRIVSYEVKFPVEIKSGMASTQGSNSSGAGAQKSLLAILASAFLGGLILNLMPCVLPVLALKILSVVQQNQSSPGRVRLLGATYGIGVIASFLVLAGILIGIKSAGGTASWGMQFQNPQFLVVMTTLMTLMALNLFGVFEVTLGSGVMGAASELASKEGLRGAFFNGVVAVVLGTSCTAPVLGAAIGYAIPKPAGIILATFTMVGAGLAFPYVALSFIPPLRRFLPKPGNWMERFKVALGFPVLATGVWFLSQMTTHFGDGGPLWVGLFLITLAIAAWIFGQFVQRGTARKGLAMGVAVSVLIAGYAVALEHELQWRSPPEPVQPGSTLKRNPDDIDWQPWSAEAVSKARAEGRVVFVDFTAKWCLNCQANKKTSIEIDSVRNRLKALNAVALLGDFTRKNAAIAQELQNHGRAGVPLVLVYPKDASKPPIILPELLTPSIVLDALEQAGK